MKRLLLSLALLYSLSALAGIPYLIQPTNAPGLVGQQLFSVGNGYSWWDWGTNAASSNSTVVSASTSVGVTTNGFNFTPFLSAGVTNWVNAQDTVVSNGLYGLFDGGTNTAFGYSRTIGGLATNNDTVVSNGVYGLFNGGTNIDFGYSRTIGGLATNNDTVVSNGVFNLLNTGTNDSFAYARSVGVLATNQDLKTSNTLWLMITNVYVDVGGNGGTTNRSGQNVTFTVVPGGGGSFNSTNLTLWNTVTFTNATLQSSLVWDGTTLTQQGGTNLSSMSNLLVTGWATINGVQTNLSTLYAPNFVTPTNTPTDGYVVTATGTAGATKWAAGGAGAQTNDAILIAGDASVTIVTNTATAGKTKYTITSAGGTPTNSIYGGVFGTNVDTGQLVIDAHGNFAQYGTNASMFQLKDTSSNVWFAATSSNTTVIINGTMNLASAGFTNANFLNPPYMSGANITNVYASNIVSGGQLPLGTVSTGVTAVAGPFLTTNGAARSYSYNAAAFTNLYASNIVSGGQLPLGTVSTGVTAIAGPFLTTNGVARSYSYNSSAFTNADGSGLASTNWVINTFASLGGNVYSSGVTNALVMTNNAAGEFGYRTNIWQGQVAVPNVVTTNTTGNVVANAYIRHYVSTNTYATVSAGPVTVVSYLYRTGGSGVRGHYEFYGVDSVTKQMTELCASAVHDITETVPTLHQFPMSVAADYTPANPMYVAVAFRVDSLIGGASSMSFVSGSNYDAHMSFARPLSSATISISQVSGLSAALAAATNNDTVVSNGITARLVKSIGITIDGGGSAITSGVKGFLEVPYACTVLSATILGDQSGTIAVETWRTNSANMPPTRAGALFTNYLDAAQASTDATLTGATSLALATQDRIGFNVTTNANAVTRITLQLRVQP